MIKVALAGQPNCGKSTLFTMLSGINQHVANYPGVTIDKKIGHIKYDENKIELTDLPGTYSFSSFSLEEKVTKRYLIEENPDIIINVIDASCLKRSLYLTFQLLEIGKPVIIALNMMDIAKRRGLEIDIDTLSNELGVPVIATNGVRGIGKQALLSALSQIDKSKTKISPFRITYAELDPLIERISKNINNSTHLSPRWLAIKYLEKEEAVINSIDINNQEIDTEIDALKGKIDVDSILASERYKLANHLYSLSTKEKNKKEKTFTDFIDKIVLNRWCSFIILLLVIYGTYELAIVKGYELTNYTWPYLAKLKNLLISLLPEPQFVDIPLLTELGIWLINSALALLNYIPIFIILFAIIAIMEDVGYMPRIAFILDRIFRRYGLHGQSTLPLVLGGAFVGGCAVPGIMATKGIADERARIATALTVPYMNCLAKVPFYTLLLGSFFVQEMTLMMFFISTVTLFIALSVAKILTSTFLKTKECAPFIMALPSYHIPSIKNVSLRVAQRVWLYIYKVGTIVMAVAIVLFVLLQFPGISSEKQIEIDNQAQIALDSFYQKVGSTPYQKTFDSEESVIELLNLYNKYRADKMASSSSEAKQLDADYALQYPFLFNFIKPKTNDDRAINRAIRKLSQQSQLIQNEIKSERIENSFLGMFGRFIEPATQFAGFDWRINVAFLSSFAARESAVATIGAIYTSGQGERIEQSLEKDSVYTPLHASAMLIFMIFTPPCIASMVVVKLNVHSYGLMLLAIFMPFIIGMTIASIFYTLSLNLHWDGVEMMGYFYAFVVTTTIILGSIKRKKKPHIEKNLKIYVRQQ